MKTQKDFEDFVQIVKQHIPSFEIIQKKDSWFQRLLGFLLWPINDWYMHKYVSVMFGKMYLPTEAKDWSYDTLYEILRHEFIHLLDAQKYPILFELSYIFALPAVFTMRSFWELRAFTQTMLVLFENTGKISDAHIDWIVSQFVTSRYAWMNPFEKKLREKLELIRIAIQKGEIKGMMYPYL